MVQMPYLYGMLLNCKNDDRMRASTGSFWGLIPGSGRFTPGAASPIVLTLTVYKVNATFPVARE